MLYIKVAKLGSIVRHQRACTNMPRTFFDLNLLANMVAKLGNIIGQFGHNFRCFCTKKEWI